MAIIVKDGKQSYTGADAFMQNAASFVGGAIGAVKRAGGAIIGGAVQRGQQQAAQQKSSMVKGVASKVSPEAAQRIFGSQANYNAMDGLMK